METIIVILLCIVCLIWIFELKVDKNKQTGETIVWWTNLVSKKRNFIILC